MPSRHRSLRRPSARRPLAEALEPRTLFSVTPSPAVIAGPWSFATGNGTGTITFDNALHITGGSVLLANGTTITPTGSYAVNADGSVTLTVQSASTFGAISATADVIAVSNANDFSLGLLLSRGSGVTFSKADLKGAWPFAFNGPLPSSNGLGTLVFNGNGGIAGGSLVNGTTTGTITGGSYTISPTTGAVTVTILSNAPGGPTSSVSFTGYLNAGKDVLALNPADFPTAADLGAVRLLLATHPTGFYSTADAAGHWSFSADGTSGDIFLDGRGHIVGGSTTNGSLTDTLSGTYAVSPSGLVAFSIVSTVGNVHRVLNYSGALNAARNVVVMGQPSLSTVETAAVLVRSGNRAPVFADLPLPLATAVSGKPFVFSYDDLFAAAAAVDYDRDALLFQITSLAAGTLTVNGTPAAPGTLIADGDTLAWTPPASGTGFLTAFSVKASDGVATSSLTVPVVIKTAPPPTLSIAATRAAAESANPALTAGLFTLTRAGGDLSQSLTVPYFVAGTATAGDDFTPLAGTVTFLPGKSTATITLTAVNDAVADAGETVQVTLTADPDDNYRLNPTRSLATLTIADNEPVVSVAATKAKATELNGATTGAGLFTFTRTGPTTGPLTVSIALTGAAANTADLALASLPTTITFQPGQASVKLTIPVADDLVIEGAETLTLALAPDDALTYSVSPARGQASLTIADHNRAPSVVLPAPTPFATAPATPLAISYEDLLAATAAADPEGQPITFKITLVNGGTLTKNGVKVVPGLTTLTAGDTVLWTPPARTGTRPAFTLIASDGVAKSKPVLISVVVA
jgi:hypothetical protein